MATSVKCHECDEFLRSKREEALDYVRRTWLVFLLGEDIASVVTYARLLEFPSDERSEYVKENLENLPSRHAMRKSLALGDLRWGTAVLEAQLEYGERKVEKFFKKIKIGIYDKTKLSEILPVEIFGHNPLGEEWYE